MRFNTELYFPAATGQIALVGKLVPSQHLPFIICPRAYLGWELTLRPHRKGAKWKAFGFITGKSQNKCRSRALGPLSLFTCLLGCKIGMQQRLIRINCITPTRSQPKGEKFSSEFRLLELKAGNFCSEFTWMQLLQHLLVFTNTFNEPLYDLFCLSINELTRKCCGFAY